MTTLIYNNQRHSYIGERIEVEEEVMQAEYERILTPAFLPRLEQAKREAIAWELATDEDYWNPDRDGVTVLAPEDAWKYRPNA